MTREEAINEWTFRSKHIKEWLEEYGEEPSIRHYVELIDMAIEALTDRPTGSWISEIDIGTRMWKCSVCGCRVQEEKYRIAVGTNATRCPYCGAELGLGGYSYDEYANRPSQRNER